MAKWALVLAIILPLFLTSCGRAATEAEDIDFARYFEDRSLFIGETLTISICDNAFGGIVHRAREYMRENPGVYIEVNRHRTREGFVANVTTQLFAGVADTLIMASASDINFERAVFETAWLLDWHNPRVAHFFGDFFPIMKSTPDFNEADWHMNVLNAMATNGRLTTFPLMFDIDIFAGNRNIPALAEVQGGHITLDEMLDLHSRFAPDDMLLYPFYAASDAIPLMIASHIDMENHIVDFYNQDFMDFLNDLRALSRPANDSHVSRGTFHGSWNLYLDQVWSYRYLFRNFEAIGYSHRLIYDESHKQFISPAPLVDRDNNLFIDPRLSFALNANATPAQQALAFDFIRFFLCPGFWSGAGDNLHPPIILGISPYRPVQTFRFRYWYPALVWNDEPPEKQNELAQAAIDFHNKIAEMPATIRYPIPAAIKNIMHEVLRQFNDGLIDARQTAELLQNRITIVLMEMD